MTIKYVDAVTRRNDNIMSGIKRTVIFDDQGKVGLIPAELSSYISQEDFGNGLIRRTKLTCTALPITVADDAGVAQYGGVKVFDFPEGMLLTMGAVIGGNLAMPSPFIDAFTGVISLGTVTASTGSTLVSTEATILQSVALATASSKVAAIDAVSIATALTEAGSRWLDGTTTPVDMYLNIAIADNVAHTAATGTFTGTIEFVWLMLGDN